MKRIIGTIRFSSILAGALFFLLLTGYSRSACLTTDSTVTDSMKTAARKDFNYQNKLDSMLTDTIIVSDSAMITDGDTTKLVRQKKIPSPQRATILSAVVPGLGQAYNHKYWKIPIIYSLGAGLYYFYYVQNDIYQTNKRDWQESEDAGDPDNMSDTYYNNLDVARKRRDYAVIFMGILYLANIVDAMADAYFLHYDISDDLSVELMPNIIPETFMANNYYSCGISINFHF